MAEGAALERDFDAVAAKKRGGAAPASACPTCVTATPAAGRLRFESGGVLRRDRSEDFIIVAAGRRNLK